MKRRVDQVEFLDLGTVRRTIRLTLDVRELAKLQSRQSLAPNSLMPLGWFAPWANAGVRLVDEQGRVLPYLTSEESDDLIRPQIEGRIAELKLGEPKQCEAKKLLEEVRGHRKDPGVPGLGCPRSEALGGGDGWVELVSGKWGCPAVRDLLDLIEPVCNRGSKCDSERSAELARIALAWQTNFVLLARYPPSRSAGRWACLELSYNEELRDWEPPWERRVRALGKPDLRGREARECRELISRGGPFAGDLNALWPRHLYGLMARQKALWLRRLGRRELLGRAWHVAWHQASGLDVPSHQVDVILPTELTVVRMRILRATCPRERLATVADQTGSRATIVAPEFDRELEDPRRTPRPPLPTLFSLVITQRSPASWRSGAALALLSAVAIVATALWALPQAVHDAGSVVTILVAALTLVSALLAVRASSEIAEELTIVPRRLIAAVGVLAVACGGGLVVQRDCGHGSLCVLKVSWLVIGGLLGCIAWILYLGDRRIRELIKAGRRASRRVPLNLDEGNVLNPPEMPRIPPPDRWLAADEGELVPWGWLSDGPYKTEYGHLPAVDRCFWHDPSERARLMDWVQDVFGWKPK